MQFQEIKESCIRGSKVIIVDMADKASVAVVRIQLARKVLLDQAKPWQSRNVESDKKVSSQSKESQVGRSPSAYILKLFLVPLLA